LRELFFAARNVAGQKADNLAEAVVLASGFDGHGPDRRNCESARQCFQIFNLRGDGAMTGAFQNKHGTAHSRPPKMELTTMVGCPLMCTFCPQDNLRTKYGKATKYMRPEDLSHILE